jgi:glutamate formiminotransferase/formiminotetrahydrofolate cyclodeaminase
MLRAMVVDGNQNSITDAGVGVLCIKTAVRGAYFNVLVNAKGLKDGAYADEMVSKAKSLLKQNHEACDSILELVEKALA